jgi:hypothetical protein
LWLVIFCKLLAICAERAFLQVVGDLRGRGILHPVVVIYTNIARDHDRQKRGSYYYYMDRVPISAEARGKRRLLKTKLAKSATRLEATLDAASFRKLVAVWCLKGSHKGRRRTFENIERALRPLAHIELIDHGAPFALYSYLKPRSSVAVSGLAVEQGDLQPCIATYYAMLGIDPNDARYTGTATGLWTLDVSDHAIGRLFERSPRLDPARTITDAHHALLLAGSEALWPCVITGREFLLPVRDEGAFVCSMRLGVSIENTERQALHVRCKTWLDRDNGTPFLPIAVAAGSGETQLRSGILLPGPLREIAAATEDRLDVRPHPFWAKLAQRL